MGHRNAREEHLLKERKRHDADNASAQRAPAPFNRLAAISLTRTDAITVDRLNPTSEYE